jgi:hypothetical protein
MVEELEVFWCASILLRDVEGRTVGYHIKYVAPSHGISTFHSKHKIKRHTTW